MKDINDADFIFDSLKDELKKRENDLIEYMNTYMSQEERNNHGDNIWSIFAKANMTIASIKLKMLADGREI